jgi:hypothetical protein
MDRMSRRPLLFAAAAKQDPVAFRRALFRKSSRATAPRADRAQTQERSGHALTLWNRNPDAAEMSRAVGAGNTLEKGPSLRIDMADRRSVVAEHSPRIHPHGGTT